MSARTASRAAAFMPTTTTSRRASAWLTGSCPRQCFRAAYGLYYSAPQFDITRNLAANPPEFVVSSFANDQFDFIGARKVEQGFDRPPLGSVQGALRAVDIDARTPYTQQWNAAIQQELPSALVSDGRLCGHERYETAGLYEHESACSRNRGARCPATVSRASTISRQFRTDSIRAITVCRSPASAASRRVSRFQLAYTYSHADRSVTAQFGGVMDIRNIALDRGNGDTDVRHRAVASWTYALPFRASGRVAPSGGRLAGEWHSQSLWRPPFSVALGEQHLEHRIRHAGRSFARRLAAAGSATPQRWFDTEAFATPGPQQFGNGGRNILSGPGTKQLDLSLFKAFPFSADGGRRVEFRTEVFNLTNTPQFNNPNATFGNAGFGTITSAGAPLTLQRTSRQIQLALKLYF